MLEIKAPTTPAYKVIRPWVFLSGSIETGKAEKWQDVIVSKLREVPGTIFNPRRDDWDSSWRQSIEDPRFFEQVAWELRFLEQSDIVLVYFAPGTMSPVSMLELGTVAKSHKFVRVYCPDGFRYKGNIDMLCRFYYIGQVKSLEELADEALAHAAARFNLREG